MEITKVERFECPLCNENFSLKVEAEKCFLDCDKEKKKQLADNLKKTSWTEEMNKIRLNADSVEMVRDMIVSEAKRCFGMVIKFTSFGVTFGEQEAYHHAPIGTKTDNKKKTLGWSGRVEGEVLKKGRNQDNEVVDCFSDLFHWRNSGFVALHTGTGGGQRAFCYHFEFFLDDFPKLKAKYEQFLTLKKNKSVFLEKVKQQDEKVSDLAIRLRDKDPAVREAQCQVDLLEAKLAALKSELNEAHGKRNNLIAAHYQTADDQRQSQFSIPDKFKYDDAKFSELEKIFKTYNW